MSGTRDVVCAGNAFVVSACVAKGRVSEAWSTGKMARDMNFLQGAVMDVRSPGVFRHPACICNDGHILAAARAVEHMAGLRVSVRTHLLRNVALAARFVSDHLAHFYFFHLADWLHPACSLRADPVKTARMAEQTRSCPDPDGAALYRATMTRMASVASGAGGGSLGAADSEHPAYTDCPHTHLLVQSHCPAAQATRVLLADLAALPRPAFNVGGIGPDGEEPVLGAAHFARCRTILDTCRTFVRDTYLPDLLLLARSYPDWAGRGGSGAFLAWDEFFQEGRPAFFPGGEFALAPEPRAWTASSQWVREVDDHIWADGDADRYRLRFAPEEPRFRWSNERFRWFGAPRHDGQPCEVGPLARVLGAYAQGNEIVRDVVDGFLDQAGLPLAALNSVLGRLVARGLEADGLLRAASGWLDDMERETNRSKAAPWTGAVASMSGQGVGLAEVGRGALMHRLFVENGRVVRHEYLIPSLWNFSPRDGVGNRGPLEQALLNTPVADSGSPLEIARVVHGFDPCNACAVRIEDQDRGRVVTCAAI